jgi:aminopeptidase N
MTQLSPEALLRDEAQVRARQITNVRYDVALDVTTGDEEFGSRVTVRFTCTEPGATSWIDLTANRVERITFNGREIATSAATGYRIPLEDLQDDNVLEVVAVCAYSRSGQGLHWFKDPTDDEVYLYSQFEPRNSHRAYACFDQPDIKARFTFTVTAPAAWVVVSNTVATVTGNVHTFAESALMSSYITAIVAGPYAHYHDKHREIDLGFYCRKSLAKDFEGDIPELVEITRAGFDFFEEYFDKPYMWGKYDQLMVPEFNAGAMENAGCVTFNEMYVFRSKVIDERRERRGETILHEMAHMWFGDLVTMRWWDDLWLNESFATYMATIAMVGATRWTNYWTRFGTIYKAWALRQDQLPTTHPIVADCPDTETAMTNFDGISYAKGASVLKQLVAYVGDTNFRDGVRLYLKRFPYGNATLADFLGCQEETSGRDLKTWGADWLETAGVNTLQPRIETENGSYARVTIEQTATQMHPTIRAHRLRVGLYDAGAAGLTRRQQVELDVTGASTPVADVGGKVADLLLVNDDDLTFAKIRLDERSVLTARDRLRDLADPLARGIVWTAAIDQLSEAELPARDFVALVVNNIGTESDSGLVTMMLSLASQAFTVFGDPANVEAARLALATESLKQMREAEPGSDLQLVWARTFIGNARTPEHVGLVRELFDGTERIEGLAIDRDVRWGVLGTLARIGAPDAGSMVDRELAADPGDDSERRAATCRASLPTAEAKQIAWEKILDPDLPMQLREANYAALALFEQAALVAPYEDRYFDALPMMWERGPVEVAVSFAGGAFPLPLISEALIERIETWLAANPDGPPPYQRYLREKQDLMRRGLKGRALDRDAGQR